HPSLIRLPDFNFARHATDDFLRARHAFTARRIDVHRAVILNVNLGPGLSHNALDGLPAGSDEGTDLLRINFDRLDPGRVSRKLRPWLVECGAHDVENLRARLLCTLNRFRYNFVTDTCELQVQLKAGHACVCSA